MNESKLTPEQAKLCTPDLVAAVAGAHAASAAPLPNEERPHHPYSPSSLQYREVCPLFKSRSTTNARAVAGTLGHNVVDTGEDDARLSDKDAAAAAECLELVAERKALMEEAAKRAFDAAMKEFASQYELYRANKTPKAPEPPDPLKFMVQELKEIYLPIDDCVFPDGTKSTTAGYVDYCLLSHDVTYAELLDWKFGMWAVESADRNLQGIAYALGLFKKYPTLQRILFTFKQPHLDLVTSHMFTRANIPDLYLRVQAVVAQARLANERLQKDPNNWDMARPYTPCCNFCDRLGDCRRGLEFACKVSQKFMPLEFPSDIDPMKVLDPHNTTLALRLASVMKVWADAFKSRVTERVLNRQCDTPEGFCIQERDGRRKIADPEKFKNVALRYISEDDLKMAIDYSFGPVEDAIALKAPRGDKKASVERFQKDIEECGAVTRGLPYSFLAVAGSKKGSKTTSE